MKYKGQKFGALFLTALLTAGLLSGCGSSDGKQDAQENVLNFGCTNFSDSLDPSAMINAAWSVSRYSIGECLFRFDDEMNAEANLCDQYVVDDSHTIWKFHIRDDVKFSNGKKLTASAVVDSISYLYEQEKLRNGSSTPSQYMEYETIAADDTEGVITIVTKKAYADLTEILAHPYFVILDVNADSDIAEQPIGTGPYAIKTYQQGTSITMTANSDYWNGTVPYEKVNVIFIKDNTAKALALKSGDVDVVENISNAAELESLDQAGDFQVSQAAGTRCGFSYINHNGVLANETLRSAVLMALDDDTMCNVTVGGMYSPGYSLLPSTLDYGYSSLNDKSPYNVEKAEKLLDEAGIKDTDGDGYRELDGKNLNLSYLTYDSRNLTDFAEAVAAQLEAIGIKVTVNAADADTEWNMLVSGQYDLLANNWMTVPVGDPYSYLANWYSKSSANYCGYKNEQFDKIYEKLESELKEENRKAYLEKLQQILIDDGAAVVHGYYKSNLCSAASVKGAVVSTADYYWITSAIRPA